MGHEDFVKTMLEKAKENKKPVAYKPNVDQSEIERITEQINERIRKVKK
jgi:hypothetical protein